MTNKFRFMLLSMAALGIVSCSDKMTDDVAQGGLGNGDDAENYVVFKIGNIGSEMRATPGSGAFDEGLANEHAVSTRIGANFVYFFDDEGDAASINSSFPLELLGQQQNNNATNDNHNSSYDPDAQEKVYQARIKGTKEELSKYKQCLVILNGEPQKLDDMKGKPLSGILQELNGGLGWYDDGTGTYFTMSNTVYVGNDLKVKSAETVTPETQICSTMAEAQQHPIVVHVERVLAKFGLNKGEGDAATPITENSESAVIEPTATSDTDSKNLTITFMRSAKEEPATGDDVTVDGNGNEEPGHYTEWKASNRKWKVKIVGWGMNATESATYWVKNLRNDGATVFKDEEAFGKWTRNYSDATIGWNDPARLRSYWAVDPHYDGVDDKDKYPHQYRTAADNKDIMAGNDGASPSLKSDLILKYNSYNTLANFPKNGYNYSVENTFDYTSSISDDDYSWFTKSTIFDQNSKYDFAGNGYKRTGTHAIVAAELLISKDEEGNSWDDAKTVYQYDSYYWEANGTTPYQDMSGSLKKYMLNQVFYHWSIEDHLKELVDNKGEVLEVTSQNFDTYFEVVAATVEGGDGRAMMQLKDNVKLYHFKDNGTEVEEIDYKKLNKILYAYGTAKRFGGGKMYYYIPIKHMSADETLEKTNEGGVTETEYQYNVGRYGVVRNHWYRLNINAIKNPGIPVDDPNQPIIPNDDPDLDYYAAFEIVILPWHVINNDVTFE